MGGFLGDWGGLEELKCASGLEVSPLEDSFYPRRVSLGGTRRAQLRPARPHRVWSVDVGTATPAEMERLAQLAERQRVNATTFVYYPEDALAENMLDPAATFMDRRRWSDLVTGGGPRTANLEHPTVRFLHSAATAQDGTWAWLRRVLVPHQRTLTVSAILTAYTGKTAQLVVNELDMTDTVIRQHAVGTTGVLQRLSHTITPTPQTVAITIAAHYAATLAAPQLTLTDHVVDWSEGAGCMSAIVVAPPTKSVQLAVPGLAWGSRAAYSWRIEEIGHPSQGHLV